MRILIISDSHGNTDNIELLKKREGKFDLIIHCGDGTGDFDYIGDRLGCRVNGVRGNCDILSREFPVQNLNIEGKIVHIEHGHRLPYFNDREILNFAENNGYDVVLYGHTHVQKLLKGNGKWVINPGSISRPRDSVPSYVIMKTDGNGGFEFEAKRL